jgi:uncharacterized membrane protein YkvA (DUF1232 family)
MEVSGMSEYAPKNKVGFVTALWNRVRLAWRLFRDPRVPLWPKIVVPAIALAYVIFPLDILPDLTPFVGQLDDLTLLALGVQAFISLCPRDVAAEHMARLRGVSVKPAPEGEVVEGEYTVHRD